jgi:hypothetical protein
MHDLVRYYQNCPRILMLHIVGAVVAWFSPVDVLERYGIIESFVSRMGSVFPVIGAAMEVSKFPGVTGLYFSIMYLFLPVRIVESAKAFYENRTCTFNKINGVVWKKIVVSIGVIFFFLFGVISIVFSRSYYEINIVPISQSRLWLGLVGPIFAGGAEGFGVAVGMVWIFIFLSWLLSKIKK